MTFFDIFGISWPWVTSTDHEKLSYLYLFDLILTCNFPTLDTIEIWLVLGIYDYWWPQMTFKGGFSKKRRHQLHFTVKWGFIRWIPNFDFFSLFSRFFTFDDLEWPQKLVLLEKWRHELHLDVLSDFIRWIPKIDSFRHFSSFLPLMTSDDL